MAVTRDAGPMDDDPIAPSPAGAGPRAVHGGSNVAPFVFDRHLARRSAERRAEFFADPKLFIAAASFIAVLVAETLLIWATAPSVADLATLYVSTT